jgi:hypothetical protein
MEKSLMLHAHETGPLAGQRRQRGRQEPNSGDIANTLKETEHVPKTPYLTRRRELREVFLFDTPMFFFAFLAKWGQAQFFVRLLQDLQNTGKN